MRYIDIKINDNYIQDIEYKELIGGSYKNDFCRFSFDKEWEEFKDKFAVFVTENDSYKKALIDNECDIPLEIFNEKCRFGIGVYGILVKGQDNLIKRNSTNLVYIRCNEGAYKEDLKEIEAVENESIYEQYISKMNEIYSKIKQEHKDIIEVIDDKEIDVKRNIDGYAIEKVNEYNENVIAETDKFNTNADNRKKEIDAVAKEVTKDKEEIIEIEKRVSVSEQNAKESADNAKTSEQKAQNSANKALESENNITAIYEDINASKAHIDEQKRNIDKSVEDVEKLVENATDQARISKEQADISIEKAGQVSADRTAVENAKNDISSMKTSAEQTKSATEQIKTDTQAIYDNTVIAKNETLQAKEEVEKSLENERIESDKKYARAIESDEIVVDSFEQIELDEDGYMKDISIESALPEITQKTRSGANLYNVKDIKRKSDEVIVDENDIITIKKDNTEGTSSFFANFMTKYSDRFEPNHEYFLIAEILDVNGSGRIHFSSNHDSDKPQFTTSEYRDFNTLSLGQKIITSIYTGENNWMGLRSFATFSPGQSGTIKYRISILKDEPNLDNFKYEAYGVSPSLDYPSPFENIVKNVDIDNNQENKFNILDYDGIKLDNEGYIVSTKYVNVSELTIFRGKPNTKYRVVFRDTNLEIKKNTMINIKVNNIWTQNNNGHCTFETDENGECKLAFGASSYPNIGKEQALIQINEFTENIPEYSEFKGYTKKIALSEGQFLGKFEGFKNYIKGNKLHSNLKTLTLTGEEPWVIETSNLNENVRYRARGYINDINSVYNRSISNFFAFIYDYNSDKEHFYTNTSGTIYFFVNKKKYPNATIFKAKLKELYDAGNPVQVLYITAEEFEEDLSLENKSKINSLEVYNGINNICSNCKIKFKANKNINNHIEEVKDAERKISNNKYAKALKDSVVDKNFAQIYADSSKINNLVLKGEQLEQETHISTDNILYSEEKYWEVGSLDGLTGQPIEKSTRLRTKEFMAINELTDYYCSLENSNYVFVNIHYYNLNKAWITAQQSISDNINEHQNQSFTTPENANFFKLVIKKVDETDINLSDVSIARPMLVKGMSKIEYIEGYPVMPSLEYPSEIEAINAINLSNVKENLIDASGIDKILGTLRIVSQEDGSIKYSGIPAGTWTSLKTINLKTPIKAGTEIIMSYGLNEGLKRDNGFNPFLWLLNKNGDSFGTVNKYNIISQKPVKLEQDVYKLVLGIQDLVMDQEYEGQMYIELERTNIMPTEFHKYQTMDYSVNLPEGQFNGAIGDNYNEIKKIDGKWCLVKYIKELILDGTENIVFNTTIPITKNSHFFCSTNLTNIKKIGNDPLPSISNFFKYEYNYLKDEEHFYINPSGNLFLYVDKEKYPDATTLKVKIKELYDAGTPIKIYYVLEEPEFVELPEETREILNSIELMEDLNNISIDNGTFSFEYNKSLARAFEEEKENNVNLQAQINEIKALLSTTNTASLLAENLAKDNESEVI